MTAKATRATTDAVIRELKDELDVYDVEVRQYAFWYDNTIRTVGDVGQNVKAVLNDYGFEFDHFAESTTAYGRPYIVWKRD